MWTVSKKFNFEAAHSLPFLPVGHKCRNLHGHSYVVEIFAKAGELDANGMVVDYAEISRFVEPLIKSLDHQNLNEILPFQTTAENLAKYLYDEIKVRLPETTEVKVYETAKTMVCYKPAASGEKESQ